jgi:hypothetical protein
MEVVWDIDYKVCLVWQAFSSHEAVGRRADIPVAWMRHLPCGRQRSVKDLEHGCREIANPGQIGISRKG